MLGAFHSDRRAIGFGMVGALLLIGNVWLLFSISYSWYNWDNTGRVYRTVVFAAAISMLVVDFAAL
jgi:hypothetical protein